MGSRNVPLSPRSIAGSEWGAPPYREYAESIDYPQSPGFPPNHRGNLATPPISGSSSNGGHPRLSNGVNRRPGEPSPPNSVGRSSYGTSLSSQEHQRRQTLRIEEKMSQHYSILKRYLGQSLRDEKGNPKPNRARDKLLRLSAIQFQELSTDVYDELLRRQSAAGQQNNVPGQVPAYLLPKENFHPKRNQARQKLATLPSSRFRDLATDVFYELERRFPHFTGSGIARNGSPGLGGYGPPSRTGTPNGTRPGGHSSGLPPRNASLGSQVMAGLSVPGHGPNDSYQGPTAKTFQSNTIIPNKSTMVEDDDDDNMSDVYGGRRDTTYTSRSMGGGSEKDRQAVKEFEAQVGELQGKLQDVESRLRDRDSELDRLHEARNETEDGHGVERERWENLRSELESKLRDAQDLNDSMRSELDRVHEDNARNEREMRAEMDAMASRSSENSEWKNRYETLDRAHQDLRADLLGQERTTKEVQQEAMGFLSQMKSLAQRSDASAEREEKLVHRVHNMETEINAWKSRHAKARTQLRSMRSGSMSIPAPSATEAAFHASDGLVKDVYVTSFQMAIDEFLRSARSSDPQSVLPQVKNVVVSVRSISLATSEIPSSAQDEHSQQIIKSRNKMSATSTNLITAAKNFAFSHGLSPVSLLDAAASHLSASVIELLRLVKVCPTPAEELDDDENMTSSEQHNHIADPSTDYYGIDTVRSSAHSGNDSIYSSHSSPPPPPPPPPSQRKAGGIPNGLPNGAHHPAGPKPTHGIYRGPESAKIEELKSFLDTRTTALLTAIQTLVSSIRNHAPPPDILDTIVGITTTTSQIIKNTAFCVNSDSSSSEGPDDAHPAIAISQTLADGVERLEQKGREGEEVGSEEEWAGYVQGLPPLAFGIARGVRELGTWVEGEVVGRVAAGGGVHGGEGEGQGGEGEEFA